MASNSGPAIKPIGGTSTSPSAKKGSGDANSDIYQLGVDSGNSYLYGKQVPGAYAFFQGQPAGAYSPVQPNALAMANPLGGAPPIQGNKAHELTANQAMAALQHLSGAALAQVQYSMYKAGLYGQSPPLYGVYSEQDSAAFRKVLIGYMNGPQQGTTLNSYLGQIADLGDKQGVNSVRKAPLVIHHVDDDTLKMTFQSAAKQILGDGKLPDDELNRMVAAYHSAETTNQTGAYNAGDPNSTGILYGGVGGNVNTTPTPSEFASSQIQTAYPDQIARQQFSDSFGKIAQTLTTPGLA
jgi:hypothetical protein